MASQGKRQIHPWRMFVLALVSLLILTKIAPGVVFAAEKAQSTPRHAENKEVPSVEGLPAGKSPGIPLTVYQARWIKDNCRFKIGMMSRQSGKSFGTSLEAVIDCFRHKTTWVFLSAGERQSKELMLKAQLHAKAIGGVMVNILQDQFRDDTSGERTEYKQLEMLFPNGSRIIALPANPATARGHSANILLDEFALHKDSRAIWTALFPSINRGYSIRIVSTPLGKKNRFYELWTGKTHQIWDGLNYTFVGERSGYSKHKVTIHDAVALGLDLHDEEGQPIEPEDLRIALADDEAWEQEYMCEFVDEASAYLPYDLIEANEDVRLDHSPEWAERLLTAAIEYHSTWKEVERPPVPFDVSEILGNVLFSGRLYIGFDVARHRDLSIIWLDEQVGDRAQCRAVINMVKQPFGVQRLVLFALLRHPKCAAARIDKTGIGADLAERAEELFPGKAVGVQFTARSKEELAVGLKKGFEDRRESIPPESTIRTSLHSVKKIANGSGGWRFDADRDEKSGHGDHFWAKALAVQARTKGGGVRIEHEAHDVDLNIMQAAANF